MRKTFVKGFACTASFAMAVMQFAMLPVSSSTTSVPDFSSLGAVGTLTAAETQTIAEIIYKGLAERKEKVDFIANGLRIFPNEENFDSVMNIFTTVVGGWDVGILANKNSTNFVISGTSQEVFISGMAVYYWLDGTDYDTEYESLMEQLDTICEGVDSSWSVPEKALYFHEYLGIHYDYDHDHTGTVITDEDKIAHTAYGILKTGKAVCEGYTWLYNILLHRVGVESLSVISEELNHTWNLVNIDGYWYHVDVTWDDYDDTHPGLILHNSFLKTSSGMTSSGHNTSDWVLSTGKAVSEMRESNKFNKSFWTKTNSVVQYYQGAWLIVEPNPSSQNTGLFNLYTLDAATGEESYVNITSQDQKWYCFDNPNKYYTTNFIIPSVNMGTIYYSTPTSIMAFHNDQHVWICNLTSEQAQAGYIYSLYTEGDMLYYGISQKYSDPAEMYGISLLEVRERIYAQAGEPTWVENNVSDTGTTTIETTEATIATENTETSAETPASSETAVSENTTIESTASETIESAVITTESETTIETDISEPTETTDVTITTEETDITITTEATDITTTTEATDITTTTETTDITTTTETTDITTTTETTDITTTTESTTESTVTTEAETSPARVSGDIDGDGIVSLIDVIAFNRYLLGCYEVNEGEFPTAQLDLYEDGVIDVFDLAMLKRLLLSTYTSK